MNCEKCGCDAGATPDVCYEGYSLCEGCAAETRYSISISAAISAPIGFFGWLAAGLTLLSILSILCSLVAAPMSPLRVYLSPLHAYVLVPLLVVLLVPCFVVAFFLWISLWLTDWSDAYEAAFYFLPRFFVGLAPSSKHLIMWAGGPQFAYQRPSMYWFADDVDTEWCARLVFWIATACAQIMLLSRFVLQYNPAAVFTAVFLVLLFPFALKLLLVLIDDTFGDFCPPCAIVLALEIYGFKWAPAASVPKCMAIGIALLGGAWAAWVLLILLLTLWTLYRTRRARKTEARARKRCQPGKGVRNEWHCRERHARSQSIDTDGEF